MKNVYLLLLLIALVFVTSGCDEEGTITDREATATALVHTIVTTATASARDELSPQDILATAEAEATAAVLLQEQAAVLAATDAAATAAAPPPTSEATPTIAATATPEVAPTNPPSPEELAVRNELAALGLDPNRGSLAWLHPPARLEVKGFQQFTSTIAFPETVVRDFVMAADITWNTEFGDAACGFTLRTSGFDADASLYTAILLRRDNGQAIFQSREDGEFLDNDRFDIRVTDFDPTFAAVNETTNRFIVMAQGNTFTLYTNGISIGQVVPQTTLSQGRVAFVTLSDSGTTVCQFDNGWLWLLD